MGLVSVVIVVSGALVRLALLGPLGPVLVPLVAAAVIAAAASSALITIPLLMLVIFTSMVPMVS
jgi:hypothetical protein